MTESIDEACRFEARCTNASASPTDESPASLNDVTEIRYHICCINQEGRCGARHTSESYGCDICELATAPYWLGSDPHNQSLVQKTLRIRIRKIRINDKNIWGNSNTKLAWHVASCVGLHKNA
jgi:hypothetical protein